MKEDKEILNVAPKLSAKEFMMLRSYALGIGELQLLKLLEVDQIEFNKIKKCLLQKLDAQNMYIAVRKGFGRRLLDPINYMEETVKSKTLDFLEKHESAFNTTKDVAGNPVWRYYPLLLKYYYAIIGGEDEIQVNNTKNKKIPPKRD